MSIKKNTPPALLYNKPIATRLSTWSLKLMILICQYADLGEGLSLSPGLLAPPISSLICPRLRFTPLREEVITTTRDRRKRSQPGFQQLFPRQGQFCHPAGATEDSPGKTQSQGWNTGNPIPGPCRHLPALESRLALETMSFREPGSLYVVSYSSCK